MLENYPLIQVIISLIILLLMGYVGYNIYLIELQNMFRNESDIRKEVLILNGTYDFSNSEAKYNTIDKTQLNFKDIKPSINQNGGAEYSYNYWLFIRFKLTLGNILLDLKPSDLVFFQYLPFELL
jgi:hypothetical protein